MFLAYFPDGKQGGFSSFLEIGGDLVSGNKVGGDYAGGDTFKDINKSTMINNSTIETQIQKHDHQDT